MFNIGLFNNNVSKKEIKAKELLSKYELDKLSTEYANSIKNISLSRAGNSLIELGI